MVTNNDVIILGAGISGLLIGSELSKYFNILIIEKNDSIPNKKYWLTDGKSSHLNPELNHCVDSIYNSLDFIAYNEQSYRCLGEYYLWDTEKLLKFLSSQIINNGAKILYSTKFYGYKYTKDKISIFANNKTHSAKLLIDCMGYSSPIVNAKGIIKIKGYYILYGKSLKVKSDLQPIGLYNVVLNKIPKYLEVFPTRDGRAYAVLIVADRHVRSNINLYEEFNFIVKKTKLNKFLEIDKELSKPLGGIIPVGNLKTTSLNNIYFFGEAGQVNPATTATGLTRMLYNYKAIAQLLKDKILKNQLSKKDLNIKYSMMSNFNKDFQFHLFNDVIKWNSDDFLQLVNIMKTLNDKVVYDLVFGNAEIRDLIKPKHIVKQIYFKNTIIIKPIIKTFSNKLLKLLPNIF